MKRIPQIDGLRAIAILLVLSFHYINNQLVNETTKIAKFFCFATSFGWAGVDLFFVLSGFLIGSILLLNKQKDKYFAAFYIRRFVRIIPTYYLLIILFLIVGSISIFESNYFIAGNNVIPTWSYFFMMQNLYMGVLNNMGNDAMSVTWSIGIEEQFYLIIPFIIYYVKNNWLPFLLVILIVFANIFRFYYTAPGVWIPAYVLPICRMDAISFGILIAWINIQFELNEFVSKYFKYLIFTMFFTISICAYLYIKYQDIGIIRNSLFALFFACALIIALSKPSSIYGKFLANRVLNWIGKISYSLYLFHYLILGIFKVIAENYLVDTKPIFIIYTTTMALIFTFLFSWIVYNYIEKPTVAFGKKFSYK
jgi:peptidoglycan/LPS O-acetylase OafA/YrhL